MIQISSREFNQDIGHAKRQSVQDPVIITERGKPTHVLLSYDEYQKMLSVQPKITKLLSCPDEIDFEVVKTSLHLKPVNFD
jgi:prevent-host-death family protein